MIFNATSYWYPTDNNPFSEDGEYGDAWSCFIYDKTIDNYSINYPSTKVYVLRVSPDADVNHRRLFNFLNYELSYGRNVILKLCDGMDGQKLIEAFYDQQSEQNLITAEHRYLVHSTTLEAWEHIQKQGALLSPNILKQNGVTVYEIGIKPMLEPRDYSDYIMLDVLDGCGELVVNSRNLGQVCTDPNVSYTPGVRLYFSVEKLLDAGLGISDGVHLLKVKDSLPLEKLLVDVISADMFPDINIWTPTTFTQKANELFLSRMESSEGSPNI
ncbi:hypothetical protein [Paenibacillus aestuarii]|uniref:Uncharacterized protein n=1 Tax=Paenibacillus aestuarii TaxID=516965 RepID=A0ABW0KEZ5_9BACL|nr:hypothetical protein [Paenibacillus aestuarii]